MQEGREMGTYCVCITDSLCYKAEANTHTKKKNASKRCKLVHTEWINNKVLLYSTGNYIQYPVINHNGKEYEKECIYMYN